MAASERFAEDLERRLGAAAAMKQRCNAQLAEAEHRCTEAQQHNAELRRQNAALREEAATHKQLAESLRAQLEAYAVAADRHAGDVARANAALTRNLADARRALAAERARTEQRLSTAHDACRSGDMQALAGGPEAPQLQAQLQAQLAEAQADARGARAAAQALAAQLQERDAAAVAAAEAHRVLAGGYAGLLASAHAAKVGLDAACLHHAPALASDEARRALRGAKSAVASSLRGLLPAASASSRGQLAGAVAWLKLVAAALPRRPQLCCIRCSGSKTADPARAMAAAWASCRVVCCSY
ncbi:hypothetical protein WJX81_000235 [Elliptochloris bilobata]|uniref:Uncharacterized protein n=1 Tax=Elliptochloris bilobata TaxID=381761 RepID=A0AAW1SE20_9CHLO